MRIGSVIADFESIFTISFKHTADRKYNAAFTNGNVHHIREQLQCLKNNMETGNVNPVQRAFDFTAADVEHVRQLFETILQTYMQTVGVTTLPDSAKIYPIIDRLRQANEPTSHQIAKDIVHEILTPPQQPKQTKKQRIEDVAKAKTMARSLNILRKNRPNKEE